MRMCFVKPLSFWLRTCMFDPPTIQISVPKLLLFFDAQDVVFAKSFDSNIDRSMSTYSFCITRGDVKLLSQLNMQPSTDDTPSRACWTVFVMCVRVRTLACSSVPSDGCFVFDRDAYCFYLEAIIKDIGSRM